MSGTTIILAMDDDSEALKINQILSSSNYHPLTVLNWKNSHWEELDLESKEQPSISNCSIGDLVDSASLDLNSVDLIIMDDELQENPKLKAVLGEINNLNAIPYLPQIFITSNPDFNTLEGIDLKDNKICLSKPLESCELLLAVESAFYKKEMETALKKSEDKYRVLIENADDPIAIINYHGEFLLVNKSAAVFFSCEEENFRGKTMWEIFPQRTC